MAAIDDPALPQLTSQDLEALLQFDSAAGPYHGLDDPLAPQWMQDFSPDAAGAPCPPEMGGVVMAADAVPLAGPSQRSLDPFLDLMPPSFVPLGPPGVDSFMQPLRTDSGAATGSGTDSAGAVAIPAAVVVTSARTKGGGGGGKKELTEEQRERIRAKNRRAQNRYREKQKAKAAESEKEYHDVARELERMRLENAELQEKQAAMNRVLAVREEFMAALEESKADAGAPLPCGCASLAQCTCLVQRSAGQAAAAQLAACHSLDVSGGAQCPLTGLTLSQIAELKRSPPEALQQDWRSIAQRLAALVQQLEAARQTEDTSVEVTAGAVEAQINSVLKEGQSFCFEHAVYQPTNVQRLFAASLDDGRSQLSGEDLQHWQAAASVLELSDSQLERLAAARTQFLRQIADVCGERRAIFARLAQVEVPDSLRSLQNATSTWLKVHKATAELEANMNREHVTCMTLVRDTFGWVFTPYQKAVAVVRSYPLFPDCYSIVSCALQQRAPALLEGAPQPKLLPAAPAST